MTDHTTCCCLETLNNIRTLQAACSAYADELTHRLTTAIAERDRARDTAARLEAELAHGFRTAAPDITLTLYPPVSGPRTPVLLTEKK